MTSPNICKHSASGAHTTLQSHLYSSKSEAFHLTSLVDDCLEKNVSHSDTVCTNVVATSVDRPLA
jgi:hypothetical protein